MPNVPFTAPISSSFPLSRPLVLVPIHAFEQNIHAKSSLVRSRACVTGKTNMQMSSLAEKARTLEATAGEDTSPGCPASLFYVISASLPGITAGKAPTVSSSITSIPESNPTHVRARKIKRLIQLHLRRHGYRGPRKEDLPLPSTQCPFLSFLPPPFICRHGIHPKYTTCLSLNVPRPAG